MFGRLLYVGHGGGSLGDEQENFAEWASRWRMTSSCGGVGDSDLLEFLCLLVDVADSISAWAPRWMGLERGLGG